MNIDFAAIKETREETEYPKVNRLLNNGWVLLNVLQFSLYDTEGQDAHPVYVLGKTTQS